MLTVHSAGGNVAITFNDETIVKLFGHEEAERETPARLVEYFVKNDAYTRVGANLRLRVLVGHKGVGKSALFKMCEIEERRDGVASVWIKPDDISLLSTANVDLNVLIREWKDSIQNIIFRKVAAEFGRVPDESESRLIAYGGGFLQSLVSLANGRVGTALEPAKRALVRDFVRKRRLVVYFDDLDRGWNGTIDHIQRIAALLNAVRDIVAETEGIYFRIALRADVYNIVRRRDSNMDKIEGDTIRLQWNNDDIFRILVRRVATYQGRGAELAAFGKLTQHQLAHYLDGLFEPKYAGSGAWDGQVTYKVILSFVRAKPRDIILFCAGAARCAALNRHTMILSGDITQTIVPYCVGRVADLINEFRSELPDIERLIYGMKASHRERKEHRGNRYTTNELVTKLKDISSQGKFTFFDGSLATPNELIRFLFRITFITARRDSVVGVERKYFDEAAHLTTQFADFGYDWEIHPAYRWALERENAVNLFSEVEPTAMVDVAP